MVGDVVDQDGGEEDGSIVDIRILQTTTTCKHSIDVFKERSYYVCKYKTKTIKMKHSFLYTPASLVFQPTKQQQYNESVLQLLMQYVLPCVHEPNCLDLIISYVCMLRIQIGLYVPGLQISNVIVDDENKIQIVVNDSLFLNYQPANHQLVECNEEETNMIRSRLQTRRYDYATSSHIYQLHPQIEEHIQLLPMNQTCRKVFYNSRCWYEETISNYHDEHHGIMFASSYNETYIMIGITYTKSLHLISKEQKHVITLFANRVQCVAYNDTYGLLAIVQHDQLSIYRMNPKAKTETNAKPQLIRRIDSENDIPIEPHFSPFMFLHFMDKTRLLFVHKHIFYYIHIPRE